ncbi:D-aminoacyl-tRNA deacylase 2-like [Saccoglossus kowalevskii]|uniref:D-aminoacyl-tRNA deacylase n=1 Tax=Saccoglossus kowalevskii TaxID=10224 RepID=A0ABM0GX22_SACKO|nr:PREDICTED: probable D-tyrosyl-tRNA(Tyr) deacylase 2-like [Saccoglossus kowalevskii]
MTETGQKAKIILQQCLSARLQVKPPEGDTPGEFVEIARGLVVYVCFMKSATKDIIQKMVKSIMNVKLSTDEDGATLSILDLPGSVLIVPQATLGGKMKGKVMQYHSNIGKTEGLEFYTEFVTEIEHTLHQSKKSKEANCVVKWGTYGNRQVLSIVTNGPFTHVLDF